ncbi:MAG: hypothetical protein GX859_10655 [Corynebacterium humireducens]|jgi:hypothetical protein|uniref:Secreted protein n=1 Tax=Corynebacterium humireducens TaxID=1223514 RepID=A0A7X6PQ53_9CORY|nr:hypothetical protein [Corynebacterium humireducens]
MMRTVAVTTAIALTVVGMVGAAGLNAPAAQAAPFPDLSSHNPLDELGRPTPRTQEEIRSFANQPWMPADLRNALLSGLAFAAGVNGDGGPELPDNAPRFTQFYWPTVSGSCIGGELDAVGSAIAVPGPAEIPAPGAADGQMAFVFTALGTAPATPEQGGMTVNWANINTLRTGATPLGNHGINPDGPATLSGAADTGHGTVVAVVSGTVHTEDGPCTFIPTAAIIDAR